MINKSMKNALYSSILKEADNLLKETEEKLNIEPENTNFQGIEKDKKNVLMSYQRIRNNAFIMLIRNGNLFYTKTDDWKEEKTIYLSVNGVIYELDLSVAKSLLTNDAEKILSKNFSKVKIDNTIDITKIRNLDFSEYKQLDIVFKEKNPEVSKEVVMKETKTEKLKDEPKNTKQKTKDKKNLSSIKNEVNKKAKIELVPDLDEFIIEDEIEIKENNKSIKKDPIEKESNINEIKKEEPEKIETLEEVNLIDDSLLDVFEPEKEEFNNTESISVEDLIMDTYIVKCQEGENSKTFTIIVVPTENTLDKDQTFTPTFAFAKIGKEVCTIASADKLRPSYQLNLDNETFVIRGGWNKEGFFSFLYPQRTNDQQFSIVKKQIKPNIIKNIGHNISSLENGINIHVLPLSSRNNEKNYVGILVCLEDTNEGKYLSMTTKDKRYVDIPYNKKVYRVSAHWEEKKLISKIQII